MQTPLGYALFPEQGTSQMTNTPPDIYLPSLQVRRSIQTIFSKTRQELMREIEKHVSVTYSRDYLKGLSFCDLGMILFIRDMEYMSYVETSRPRTSCETSNQQECS